MNLIIYTICVGVLLKTLLIIVNNYTKFNFFNSSVIGKFHIHA